jgi:hypothetical protein
VHLSCTPASTTDQHVIARLPLLLLDRLSGATATVPVPLLHLLLTWYTYEGGRHRACDCLRLTYDGRGGGAPRLFLLDVAEDRRRREDGRCSELEMPDQDELATTDPDHQKVFSPLV